MAETSNVLHRLLFIGRAISEPDIREGITKTAGAMQSARFANDAEEFSKAMGARNADWVYVRFLPSKEQIEAIHHTKKRAFIAGPTVSGKLPENWRHAVAVGVDAILTDDPLELRTVLSKNRAKSFEKDGM